MENAITEYLKYLKATGYPPTTIRLRRVQLTSASKTIKLNAETKDIINWLSKQNWKQETRRSYTTTLKHFYNWATQNNHITNPPNIPKIKPAHPHPKPAPETAIKTSLKTAPNNVKLMITLAARLGLRRGEIATIHETNINTINNQTYLTINGKGSKQRTIPLPQDIATQLTTFKGWLFPGNHQGHLSPNWIGKLIARELPKPWTAHTLRHRFATNAYNNTHDLLAIQTILGHTTPTTTRRYIAIPETQLINCITAAT